MHLNVADIRAAREGFKYVAVRAGKRVAYCTTKAEAKREAGAKGQVISLTGMRYTAQNPSGAKQRSRGTRRYGQTWHGRLGEWTEDRSTDALDYNRELRQQLGEMKEAGHRMNMAKTYKQQRMRHNPFRFPLRSPSIKALKGLGINEAAAQEIKRLADQGLGRKALERADVAMGGHGVESLYPEFPKVYYVNKGDTYDTTLYSDGSALRIGAWGDYVEKHSRQRNPSGAR